MNIGIQIYTFLNHRYKKIRELHDGKIPVNTQAFTSKIVKLRILHKSVIIICFVILRESFTI